jgi:hypothetical protein
MTRSISSMPVSMTWPVYSNSSHFRSYEMHVELLDELDLEELLVQGVPDKVALSGSDQPDVCPETHLLLEPAEGHGEHDLVADLDLHVAEEGAVSLEPVVGLQVHLDLVGVVEPDPRVLRVHVVEGYRGAGQVQHRQAVDLDALDGQVVVELLLAG